MSATIRSKFLRDNGLSIALFLLFFFCLLGQSVAGYRHHNNGQKDHGQAEVAYFEYLKSAEFVESVFENWESEFLQMAVYVFLTSCLYQRGSAESKGSGAN